MIKNYFKTTLRHLWRNRLFTALNVLGLATGISASWTIYRIVDYEFSYDKAHPDAEHTYQLVVDFSEEGEINPFAGIERAISPAIKNDVAGVELVVPVYRRADDQVTVFNDNQEAILTIDGTEKAINTLSAYFDMVPYRWLAGSKDRALNNPNQVVLTESRAAVYFPETNPTEVLGKTLYYNDTLAVTVSGVVADLPYPSSFEGQEFFRLADQEWNSDVWGSYNSDDNLYVKLSPKISTTYFIEEVNKISLPHNKKDFEEYGYQANYKLLPLSEKHFATSYAAGDRVADKKVMYGLIGVAAFILLLACINYINLSTAQLPQRAREIGIRKTLGSAPNQLIGRFLGETFVVALMAAALSWGLTAALLSVYREFIPDGLMDFPNYLGTAAFLLALIVLITGLSGMYPAWLITRVQTVNVLKGQAERVAGSYRFNLRKALTVFQFIIAQVFIVSAVIIGQQLRYTLKKDLGFDKEAVVTVDIPFKIRNDSTSKDKHFVLKQELSKHPGIAAVALGDRPLSNTVRSTYLFHHTDTGKTQQTVFIKYADTDFLDLYGFHLVAGKKLSASDTTREYLVNEALVKAFGFTSPEAAIGTYLSDSRGRTYPITGVLSDFHNLSFKAKIPPLAFTTNKSNLSTVNIKLARAGNQDWSTAIQGIETVWKSLYPKTPFQYRFYDDSIAQMYKAERDMSKLVGLATGVTILVSCLGLFGLATLTASQRTKEIGIRKVLGATVSGIVGLLSTDFVKLVVIAVVIASPIAWWVMNKWLEDFAYRIEIQWWMFAVAGLAAVAIALLTVSWQAIRAAVANPVNSLRDE